MPENNVNIAPLNVPFEAENTYVLSGAQTTITRIDAVQLRDAGLKFTEFYDFLIGSSGATGPVSVDVHHRSLRISPDPSARLAVPSFFTATINDAKAKLNAFIRLNYNNDIDLDVFYSYEAAVGIVTWDAFFWTVDIAPGSLETPLDNIANDFEHYVAIPIRQDNAARRYLIVALALP